MSWDRIEGQWKQGRGKAVHQWGAIMDDQLAAVSGKYEELVGRLQEKYGIAKEETKGHIVEYKKTLEQLAKSNSKVAKLQRALSKQMKANRKVVKSKSPVKKKLLS